MERRRIFRFGEKQGLPFRLEVTAQSHGSRRYVLLHGNAQIETKKQPLELLYYLIMHRNRSCSREEILKAVSPESGDNLVDKYIGSLRHVIEDDQDHPKVLLTVRGDGYQFSVPVAIEGDLAAVEGYPKWNRVRFYELLMNMRRSSDETDLRIATTGISPGLESLGLDELLARNLRIQILFMDPQDEVLTKARFEHRQDRPAARCIRDLREQLTDIEAYASRFPPPQKPDPSLGSLEYRVSRMMPCGFVAHSGGWAVLAPFLAHTSYVFAPMLEIQSDCEAYVELRKDWDIRWRNASKYKNSAASH